MRVLARAIAEQAELAAKSFYRLVVVAGPPGSGKTIAFNELQSDKGWKLLNLSKALSERLLDLTSKQRRLRTADIVRDLIEERGNQTISMLDHIGLLFHPVLQQEPMLALQRASRNHTVIAAWQGEVVAGKLIYGSPDHPEYRRHGNASWAASRTGV
ncbi:MAG: BREX-3 system P-loop-containing protein BrxF [Cyanobacteriota bacterium]